MDNDNIIYLTGDDGEELGFEFLDVIEYGGKRYAVLFPVDEQDNELVVLEIEPGENKNEEYFVDVMDDKILNAVYDVFMEKHKDEFEPEA